jgi:hypothetical protein
MTGCARPLLSAKRNTFIRSNGLLRNTVFLPPLVAGEKMPREGVGGHPVSDQSGGRAGPPVGREPERRARRSARPARHAHSNSGTEIGRAHHVTSCRMRASRRGLDSTYTAVVRMLLCPAISAIAFRSIPRSARRVISVRLPLCDEAFDMPASR